MEILAKQLERIRTIQADASFERSSGHLPNQLAFAFELTAPIEVGALSEHLAQSLPDIQFKLEALFETDHAPLHFVLSILGVSFDDLHGSEFEIMYALQEEAFASDDFKLRYIEPAIELGFTGLQLDEVSDPEVDVIKATGCFTPKCKKPTTANPMGLAFDWALQKLNVPEAKLKFGVTGAGVRVAQIDTGIATHDELERLDPLDGINLFDDPTGAKDPLTDPEGLLNPGHGTATSSVLLSGPNGHVDGVAPDVDFLAIRAIRSVIRLTQWRVAKAVDIARQRDAQIITMSLGGVWSWMLRSAIERAERENILVLAAAGNCVPFVVYPARFQNCLAVAGTSPEMPDNGWDSESAWVGSSSGRSIDVSAPAQFVWCASRKPMQPETNKVGAGEGTSFSVALTAGVAALWLEHHGHAALVSKLGPDESLMDMFRSAISGSARKIPPLGERMGSGIVDALALLEFDVETRPKGDAIANAKTETVVDHTLEMLEELGTMKAIDLKSPKLRERLAPVALEIQTLMLKQALKRWELLSHPIDLSTNAKVFLQAYPMIDEALGHPARELVSHP